MLFRGERKRAGGTEGKGADARGLNPVMKAAFPYRGGG